MLKKRIIPCLDIKNGKVVKGICFENLKEVGNPATLAKRYEMQNADEIVFLDISATEEEREILKEIIEEAASTLSIPLTVGGGIRSLEDFRMILRAGADKVSINSAAIQNSELIQEAAKEFGTQCVVVAIDAKRMGNDFKVFCSGGKINTGKNLLEWAIECERLGAGEILLTSMDRDGTKNGYDIEMLEAVCQNVRIPVIASGGCGSMENIVEVFQKTKCDAALVASLFHYGEVTVNQVKEELEKNKIKVRRAV